MRKPAVRARVERLRLGGLVGRGGPPRHDFVRLTEIRNGSLTMATGGTSLRAERCTRRDRRDGHRHGITRSVGLASLFYIVLGAIASTIVVMGLAKLLIGETWHR